MKTTNLLSEKKEARSQVATKPADDEEAQNGPAQLHLKSRTAKIAVPTFEGLQMLCVEDIIKCVAHESYTEIITGDAKFMVSRNLKEYEDMLSAFSFFRIHNSCLVNLRHVKKYIKGDGGYVLLMNGDSCEVSRRKKTELLSRLFILEF